jgi:hypothetical protein
LWNASSTDQSVPNPFHFVSSHLFYVIRGWFRPKVCVIPAQANGLGLIECFHRRLKACLIIHDQP